MVPAELGLISECSSACEVWSKLESTFQTKGRARKATLLKCSNELSLANNCSTKICGVGKMYTMVEVRVKKYLLLICPGV